MNFYSLIFFERPADAINPMGDAINHPAIFMRIYDAYDAVLAYVCGRVVDMQLDFVFELLEGVGVDIGTRTCDDPLTLEALTGFVSGLSLREKRLMADWYFGFADGDGIDAFYSVTEHNLDVIDPLIDFMDAAITEQTEDGGGLAEATTADNLRLLAHRFASSLHHHEPLY